MCHGRNARDQTRGRTRHGPCWVRRPVPLGRKREAALAGHLGDISTARALLADENASVRATALGALARAGDLRTADVTAALDDADAAVRRRGIEVVASLDEGDPLAADISLLPLLARRGPLGDRGRGVGLRRTVTGRAGRGRGAGRRWSRATMTRSSEKRRLPRSGPIGDPCGSCRPSCGDLGQGDRTTARRPRTRARSTDQRSPRRLERARDRPGLAGTPGGRGPTRPTERHEPRGS